MKDIWELVRAVPDTAQKKIAGGKLKNFTDINPVWRIKTLTDTFGMCGFGWKAPVVRLWCENLVNEEVAAFCEINLFVKVDDVWSEPISGIGGSMLVNTFKGEKVTNDDCYKMAYTDAISVACKMLGFGADIYWNADSEKSQMETKYQGANASKEPPEYCNFCGDEILPTKDHNVVQLLLIGQKLVKDKACVKCLNKYDKNTKTIDGVKIVVGDDKPLETPPTNTAPEPPVKTLKCDKCKGDILAVGKRSPFQIASGTKKETGETLCLPCFKKWQNLQKIKADVAEITKPTTLGDL